MLCCISFTGILKAHVVPNVICSEAIQGDVRAPNLFDDHLLISRNSSGVYAEQSRVTQADVMTSNGVIHVIDDVIVPDSGKCLPFL